MRSETLADILHCFVSEARADSPPVDGPLSGPLAGLRFGVKDLIDVAGEPTGGGCATPRVPNPPRSAEVVERLLAAGAVYAGKTHTVQLAFGGWGTNTVTGAPRNPWDADAVRIAGGSSSGSAVAVASGLVDFALGTDTGGSVRIPASLCGVVGLKPTWGCVSTQGVLPLAPSLDSVGPLAGDVATAARAFAVMADRPVVTAPAALGSLKFRALGGADLTGEDDVLAAYASASAKLEAAGGSVERLPLPVPPGDYVQPTGRILGYEAWAQHGDLVRRGEPPGPRRPCPTSGRLLDRGGPIITRRSRSGLRISRFSWTGSTAPTSSSPRRSRAPPRCWRLWTRRTSPSPATLASPIIWSFAA